MKPSDTSRVAIVGAGLAGLSSAARLLHNHAIAATVFESQPRAGGRVHSVTAQPVASDEPLVLDLGATWFHGTRGNAAYDVACRSGALADQSGDDGSDQWEEDHGVLLFSAPAVAVSRGVARVLDAEKVLPVVRSYGASLQKAYDGRVNPSEEKRNDEGVLQFVSRAAGFDDMTLLDRAIFRARDAFEACVNGCDSSTADLSLKRMSDYVTLEGDNVMLDCGMQAVVDAFLDQLQQSQLVLNRKVVHVAYGDKREKGVRVKFEDGSIWEGDSVIWTPSINVTKRAVNDGVFEPNLPKEKIAAMESRVQGVVEKIFVFLNGPLHNVPSDSSMPIIWENNEAIPISQQWCTNVYSVLYSSKHCMVSFWLTGEAAKHVCSLQYDLQLEQMAALLSVLYSQQVRVEKVVCSNWSLKNWTLGSYSYAKVGCSQDAVQTLAEPLPSAATPILCFAGEATHKSFYSTMHGAIESGYREADRVAAYLKLLSLVTS